MTIEEAKEYIPDFEAFRKEFCAVCVANDWYCPSVCDTLLKASELDYNSILKCYARNDGEMYKVWRWLKQARVYGKNGLKTRWKND